MPELAAGRSALAGWNGQGALGFAMTRWIKRVLLPPAGDLQRESLTISMAFAGSLNADLGAAGALRGWARTVADGQDRPAVAMVVARAACRSKAVPDGAERDHPGGAGLVRRAGF